MSEEFLPPQPAEPASRPAISRGRWVVCGLLTALVTISLWAWIGWRSAPPPPTSAVSGTP